jgi:hypothetical protein
MKLAIMQPYFFPYIGYFQLINAVDRFVVYDDVNYIKRGWVNRNRIALSGEAHLFSVPVLKASQNVSIAQIAVDPDQKWREKLLLTIKHAYKDAPQFTTVFPMVEKVLSFQCFSIGEYASNSITSVLEYLHVSTTIVPSSAVYGNQNLKGSDRILDICKKEGAKMYINPPGGSELYNKHDFEQSGVTLKFINMEPLTYNQQGNEFIANLSIIDVLMFNSATEVKKLLSRYTLV